MPRGDEEPDPGFSAEKLTEGSGDVIVAVATDEERLSLNAEVISGHLVGIQKGKKKPEAGGPKP